MADMQNQKTNPSQQSGSMENKKPTDQKDNKTSSESGNKTGSGSSSGNR